MHIYVLMYTRLPGGNPPTEASPDSAYKPYKGSKVAVGGGCQMEEAAGLVPRSCPVPYSRI